MCTHFTRITEDKNFMIKFQLPISLSLRPRTRRCGCILHSRLNSYPQARVIKVINKFCLLVFRK